eukprot:Ihof_evm13s73 gene=Ihof_evmTU13s73
MVKISQLCSRMTPITVFRKGEIVMQGTKKNDIIYKLDAPAIPLEEAERNIGQKGPNSTHWQETNMVLEKKFSTKTKEPGAHAGLMAYEVFQSSQHVLSIGNVKQHGVRQEEEGLWNI